MTVWPVGIDEEWHERLRARLMDRIRLRQRAAHAEARFAELEAALAAAEAERDEVAREIVGLADATLRLALVLNVAGEIMNDPAATWTILGRRATRLAALEQAARAWRADDTVEAESIFWDAVADLDAPPGKGA